MRIAYFDFLRGAAIVMVVAIHCMGRSLSGAELSLFEIAVRNAMNVAVPLFLGISGFFCAQKNFSSANSWAAFLKRQLPRVYLPVLFCSLPILVSGIVAGHSVPKSLILYFICGDSVYYFVAVIIQCYLGVYLFERIAAKSERAFRVLLGIFAVLCLAGWGLNSYVVGPVLHLNPPLILYAGGIWMWGAFFLLGFYFGKNREVHHPMVWIICVLGGGVLCMTESLHLNEPGTLSGFGQKASAMAFSFSTLGVLFSEKCRGIYEKYFDGVLNRLVVKLGRYSFGIYLIHCFLISRLDSLLKFHGTLKWVVLTLSVLVGSFFVLFLAKRAFPKFSRLFLGV